MTIGALLLLVAGGAYLGVPALTARQERAAGARENASRLQQAQEALQVTPKLVWNRPVSLRLPRLNIEKTILTGAYNLRTSTWTLDNTHAFYMPAATTPLIYGHNTEPVFKDLNSVAADDLLVITDVNGQEHTFRYVGDETYSPKDASILDKTYDNTVLLMTCSGQWYQHRRVLQFRYVGSQAVAVVDHRADRL